MYMSGTGPRERKAGDYAGAAATPVSRGRAQPAVALSGAEWGRPTPVW
jgi:hypothetical protein